jgi:hypothetical protein
MSLFPAPSFGHYWSMWNERDLDLVRCHLQQAVTDDFVFCDPVNFHVGRDALERNVREFREQQPLALFVLGSGVDSHHDRCRYEWHLTRRGRVLVRGFDVATIADDGLIERIDGFFGPLPPLQPIEESG